MSAHDDPGHGIQTSESGFGLEFLCRIRFSVSNFWILASRGLNLEKLPIDNFKKNPFYYLIKPLKSPYSQTSIVVVLIVVNFFCFLVINRYRGGEFT